jgi:hypothetical protein
MGKPIAPALGIAFAFPDVCKTPSPAGDIPIPYPNIAQLDQVQPDGKSTTLKAGGQYVLLEGAEVSTSMGDEAGASGGVKSGGIKGPCKITQGSKTVKYNGKGIVRFMDPTQQNDGNAVGMVLSANPTILVGG